MNRPREYAAWEGAFYRLLRLIVWLAPRKQGIALVAANNAVSRYYRTAWQTRPKNRFDPFGVRR